MKVFEFLEHDYTVYNLNSQDMSRIFMDIDMDKHWLLSAACAEWINPIEDDQAFCDAEWNFMQYWYKKNGFSVNDWRYVRACGYEQDQFIGGYQYEAE